MGPGSWVIVAIVVLQLVAGGIAKAAEARKAKGKPAKKGGLDSLLSKIAEASKGGEADSADQGGPLTDRQQALEKLRKKRIAALRDRQASDVRIAPPTTTASPEVPDFVVSEPVTEPAAASRPSAATPPPAPVPEAAPAEPRRSRSDRGRAGRKAKRATARGKQPVATKPRKASSGGQKPASKKPVVAYVREQSPIFDSAIAKSGLGRSPEDSETARSGGPADLSGLLRDPDQFRQAFIFAELLKPPVSLRPGGNGGLDS